MRSRGNISNQKNKSSFNRAFTVIELIVVVAIIAILAAIIIISYSSWRQSTTVAQLKSDLSNAASAMENYRTFNNAYPTTVPTTFTASTGVTLTGGSSDGGVTFCVSAVNSQFPSLTYHIDSASYQTGASPGVCTNQCNLVVIAGVGGTVTGGGTFACGTVQTIAATANTFYGFGSWTGDTGCSGAASHTITITLSTTTCTAGFPAIAIIPNPPVAPTISQNTVGPTTTFSWNATSCGTSTARYQYDYTISPAGYDSGWVQTAATSVDVTTSTEGQTYAISVQTQCYNVATSTSWSTSGTNNYARAITVPTNLVATAASSTSVNVTWNSVASATSYTLSRSLSPSFTSPTNITQSGTSYTSTGLQQGTQYYYEVEANNAGGSSNWSSASNAITTIDNPTPNPVTISNSTAGATTTWTFGAETCPGGTSVVYQYRYTYSPGGYDSGLVTTSATSVAFTTSTSGQAYSVVVQAKCHTASTDSGYTSMSAPSTFYNYTLSLAGANCASFTGAGAYTGTSPPGASFKCNPTNDTYYVDYWDCTDSSHFDNTSSSSITQSLTLYANTTCTVTTTHWIPGQNGQLISPTVYVYYKDLAGLYAFKVNLNPDNSTWSYAPGVDPSHPTKRVLRNPQTDGSGLDWQTYYPAQYRCLNTTNGRLPMEGELASIMSNKTAYNNSTGGLFGQNGDTDYVSADETTDYDTSRYAGRDSVTGNYTDSGKTQAHAERCVRDTPI